MSTTVGNLRTGASGPSRYICISDNRTYTGCRGSACPHTSCAFGDKPKSGVVVGAAIVREDGVEMRVCPSCQNEFPKQGRKVYCSPECQIVARVKRDRKRRIVWA